MALKLCTYSRKRPRMSMIAADLKMSPSEIHAAIERLQQSRLLHGPDLETKAAADTRPTYDVDAIAEISSYAAYADQVWFHRRCW